MFYKQMALVEEAVEKQVNAGNCPEAGTKEESSEPGAHKRKKKGGKGSRLRRLSTSSSSQRGEDCLSAGY